MSSDREKLLAPPPPIQPPDPRVEGSPMMGNPKGSPGWNDRYRTIQPPVRTGNPKGPIGGVRSPLVRAGLVLGLVAAIGLAIWRWAL